MSKNEAAATAATTDEVKSIGVTATQQKKLESFGTKSDRIRYLNAEGFSRSAISKVLGIRYQHVRNVLITPVTGGKRGRPATKGEEA